MNMNKTWKLSTFLQLICMFEKVFVFPSASQKMFVCAPLTNQTHPHSSWWTKAKMCQGCYGSWPFVNERCPLDSLDLAEQARAHQSRVWPCIPVEVWINEFWTSNSRITPHKSSNPAQWNLQQTKMLEENQHQPCPTSQFEHRNQDRETQQRG